MDLQDIQPLSYRKQNTYNQSQRSSQPSVSGEMVLEEEGETTPSPFSMNSTYFPPLQALHSKNKQHGKIMPLRQWNVQTDWKVWVIAMIDFVF